MGQSLHEGPTALMWRQDCSRVGKEGGDMEYTEEY